MAPKCVHRGHKLIHFIGSVNGRWSETQTLCAAGYGREINGLNIDAIAVQKHIAQLFRVDRISDDDGHDMRSVIDKWKAQTFQTGL